MNLVNGVAYQEFPDDQYLEHPTDSILTQAGIHTYAVHIEVNTKELNDRINLGH